MTELGILLYQHLQSAPTFRYALVGVEVDEFRTYTELVESSSTLAFPGLVLALALSEAMELSPEFRPFSPGYSALRCNKVQSIKVPLFKGDARGIDNVPHSRANCCISGNLMRVKFISR